ncbi:MAG: cytochrome d ubiquinol oxidase subunit II [Candidatus Midichloria sp.]|nr:MAG: cytochrome d ubiquinol oxidase subunit II [Candidatus Midichloria sp.]
MYVILDGYDLGVGMAMKYATLQERDIMIASIGPFWDANETWLVFGVGILLVAFPMAHGAILTALYLPAVIMSIGLILRGVSFDFRAKAQANHKDRWDNCFIIGSTLTSLAQGYMLGSYITRFQSDICYLSFNLLVAVCLAAGYLFVGSSWLIMKTSYELQKKQYLGLNQVYGLLLLVWAWFQLQLPCLHHLRNFPLKQPNEVQAFEHKLYEVQMPFYWLTYQRLS